MGVIVIYNDINEIIGIAKDYESTINFLLDNHFLDSEFEIMDEEYRWTPLKDLNISIEDIKFNDGEVIDAKYVTFDEFNTMLKNGETHNWLDYFNELFGKLNNSLIYNKYKLIKEL